jgi:excinuclease ABC subunit C
MIEHNLDPEALRPNLPGGSGVYLFKDAGDQVIYVGKAKNIKKRVLSYFKPLTELPYKTALMMKRAEGLDYILTANEKEAFILESNLIKKHLPRYNIILRDDSQYPALRLDIQNPFPRLQVVRKIKKDGAIYFGPYSSANAVRSTLKLINRIFQLRKCKGPSLPSRSRPCLNHQLDRCLGACVHEVSPSHYGEIVDQARLFLEGRNQELVKQLKESMVTASERLQFERAARIRDQIKAVEKVMERQDVVSPKLEDQDSREAFIPKRILISEPIDDLLPIRDWISDLAEKNVTIHHPIRGEKRRLTKMAVANAEILFTRRTALQGEDLMEMAKTLLKLKRTPRTIEGLDISNLQGDMAVGAIVSFVDGLPHKSDYRSYKIKNIEGIDDYGMMAEVVSRRLSGDSPPDLFLVDGGKGHLQAVKKEVDRFRGMEVPDVAAIAKGDEGGSGDKIYIPGRKNALSLRQDHPLLLLFMRIRDEAHRRAITHHRKRRGKELTESPLDGIPGVGPKRKKLLLKFFGDINSISKASLDDIAMVPGISLSLAKDIANALK